MLTGGVEINQGRNEKWMKFRKLVAAVCFISIWILQLKYIFYRNIFFGDRRHKKLI